ncbi:MAG: DegT/DnrJ/EryC1/StrS family aminotransferase [Candidatus Aminicenantales bacterium]
MSRPKGLIPVSEPLIGQREIKLVEDCLRRGWISSAGAYVEAFEQAWASYCGRKYGIATSSGTAALQVALGCLRLSPGDEVILPNFTMFSCAAAVLSWGGIPVLVDADPLTWCLDPTKIEEKITPRTKAIMVVHIYGHPVDMDPVLELARSYKLAVVEDAAEAHGAEYKGRRCGGFGDLSCFSFYANKIITTGEGGMVLTNRRDYSERARSLRNLYFGKKRRFLHQDVGFNFRLTNLQAALGLAQLATIEERLAHKRWVATQYNLKLGKDDRLQLPVEMPWAKNVYWMYGIVVKPGSGFDAARLSSELKKLKVETRPFFVGLHRQPALRRRGLSPKESFPVSEFLSRYGFYLPSGLTLTEPQINRVCSAVKKILG